MNILEESNNPLAPLDYSGLLSKILELLSNQNPFKFSDDGERLRINIDEVAYQIAKSTIASPLASTSGVRSATVNFSSLEYFAKSVRKVHDRLRDCLNEAVDRHPSVESVEAAIRQLVTNLESFKGSRSALGFTYPFETYSGLQKQRLSLQKKHRGIDSLLKLHKLTITVSGIDSFHEKLKESLENYIQREFEAVDTSDREDLQDVLEDLIENPKSDFYQLQRLMDTEVLGKLKREAKIRYLEFILEHLDPKAEGTIYLQDLIRRLRKIETYIDDPNRDDAYYQVSYAGKSVNYRDLFSRAEAFDFLPILPMVEGYLGETTDVNRGERQFVFGFKLKFGGIVHSQGDDSRGVLDYYLNLLDPDSLEHKDGIAEVDRGGYFKEKVLKILFLYYFIFASRSQPNAGDYNFKEELKYAPEVNFDKQVIEVLKQSDETLKQNLLRNAIQGFKKYQVKTKIDKLKQAIQKILKQKSILPRKYYPVQIGVKQGLLERDLEEILTQRSFFKPVLRGNPKDALKYLTIKSPQVDCNYLCHLPVSISVEDIRYFPTDDRQTFRMGYDIAGMKALPLLFIPWDDPACQTLYKQSFQTQKPILLTYKHQRLKEEVFNHQNSTQAFFYRIAFALLIYLCLNVLLEKVGERLFVPIMRLHLHNRENPSTEEEFMRSLSKILSHLLGEHHQSNSQGFYVKDSKSEKYRIENSLSSLYSILPKVFHFQDNSDTPKLDKLAMIVMSSREGDRSYRHSQKISNLFGEVIGVECIADGTVRLSPLNTFSANYEHQRMFQNPSAIIDQVDGLYRQGFRHILYIAKSPYSSTLNLTQKNEDEELFFMSKAAMSSLKGSRKDIKIYPIFFDKYYVVSLGKTVNSLYIQDTEELTELVEDPAKQAVVFFNLFNGMKVPGDDRFYNGVISYSTLLNLHPGILDDRDIRLGLIYDGDGNSLKTDILQYLTLFHFSRYEKSRQINLKLDPYEHIIGDGGVGALSILNYFSGKVRFNMLAFLTEVRRALNLKSE